MEEFLAKRDAEGTVNEDGIWEPNDEEDIVLKKTIKKDGTVNEEVVWSEKNDRNKR